MPRRSQRLLKNVLRLAVAARNQFPPFCRAEGIVPRAPDLITVNLVPICAQGCLSSFVQSNFPAATCANSRDLFCLCTRRSISGFTLGEGALRCVISSCLNPGSEDLRVYVICSGIQNAIPNTHTVITATALARHTSTATVMTTKLNSSSTSSNTSFKATRLTTSHTSVTTSSSLEIRTSLRTSQRPLPTTHLSSISTLAQPTAIPSELPVPPNVAAPLNKGQVIGVSIAGAVSGSFLLALLILFILRRHRDKVLALKESGFEIGGQMSEPPRQDTPVGYRGDPTVRTPVGLYNEPVVHRLTFSSNIVQRSAAATSANGLPLANYEHSDGDDASLSTPKTSKALPRLSLLLPEKPNYEILSQHHPSTESAGRRPDSSAMVFEEEGEKYRRAFLAASNGNGQQSQHSNNRYNYTAAYQTDSRRLGHGYPYPTCQNTGRQQQQQQQQQRPRQRQLPPSLRLVTPSNGNNSQALTNMTSSAPLVYPYRHVEFGSSIHPIGPPSNGHSSGYSQDGYGGADGRVRSQAEHQSSQNRRQANHRTSVSSVTSFESVESDDGNRRNTATSSKHATFRLSPVREGPPSPDLNAYSNPTVRPLRYQTANRRSVRFNDIVQVQGGRSSNLPIGNRGDCSARLYQPYQYPYPYPDPGRTVAAKAIPKFPKFHQPPRPPVFPASQQQQQPVYSPYTNNEQRNSGASSNSSLLSKRRGEAVADRMERELDVKKASPLRPNPLKAVENPIVETEVTQGGFKTPSPSLALKRQKELAQRQKQRQDMDETDKWEDDDKELSEQGAQKGTKLTPKRRGPDLYLNVE
ncbi:hypothetical protein PAAG_04430 [Paracoccidioides lutzii Pb01]|uniref:Extracellular membrane protein CFEM domain-containing protein n=1 Tax=Paracoccidioides lutzii (strain ATCC MYA-826 / Pb01) TaxID=502779 RepID=C1H0Y6_PARBA|nr:hypothetical protein PAAG_04430 [Paracoccidioides lutzii Pb01]EEH33380.1 hypothetical protein PAAG_04430 [Paracoccidioides lutzii Pb01]